MAAALLAEKEAELGIKQREKKENNEDEDSEIHGRR